MTSSRRRSGYRVCQAGAAGSVGPSQPLVCASVELALHIMKIPMPPKLGSGTVHFAKRWHACAVDLSPNTEDPYAAIFRTNCLVAVLISLILIPKKWKRLCNQKKYLRRSRCAGGSPRMQLDGLWKQSWRPRQLQVNPLSFAMLEALGARKEKSSPKILEAEEKKQF